MPIPNKVRVTTLFAIILPFLVLVAALVFLWGKRFGWVDRGHLVDLYSRDAIPVRLRV
jgi:hypothetical protein